jgi:hypothetical protein
VSTDPFAAAQVGGNAGTATADPFRSNAEVDDPFATSSDYKGGDFTPAAPIEALDGRLVVMIPRSLDSNAKDPNNEGQTREQYTVDLYVLSGGRLTYYYNVKADPESGREAETKEMVVEDITPANPFVITGYWVPQQGILGKLKKAHKDGRPFLGVVDMLPVSADRQKGKTSAQIRAEYSAWVQRNRAGARPRYSWTLSDPSPDLRAAAIEWWKANRENIAPITPA